MTPETKPAVPTQPNDDEIDLLALAKTVWNGRKFILKCLFISAFLGIMISLILPKEYSSTATIVPQTSQSSSRIGGLSSLAAMAGFNLDNLNSQNDALSPLVYPQIVSSTPFLIDMMNDTYTTSKAKDPVSLYKYFTEINKPGILSLVMKYTIGLPRVIISTFKDEAKEKVVSEIKSDPIQLTGKQNTVISQINSRITVSLEQKQGYITLNTSFPEPLLSAQVADKACKLLQKYIIQFKIQKAISKLTFIEERYQEKKKDFEKVQQSLARYRDQNKNVSRMIAQAEEDRLQGEYSIALNVYNELAKQLEQAKIQVKEETPTFSIVQPAVVPINKSKPQKVKILFSILLAGGVLSIGWLFGKKYLAEIRYKWNALKD